MMSAKQARFLNKTRKAEAINNALTEIEEIIKKAIDMGKTQAYITIPILYYDEIENILIESGYILDSIDQRWRKETRFISWEEK